MKIIGVDNLDREYMSDILICENVDELHGVVIVDLLNGVWSSNPRFYKLVADDHILYEFKP